jgi:glycosyltransferase involved in cell wall biosynthesis
MSEIKVLLVGEHPFGFSGNSKMIRNILCTIDMSKFNVKIFAVTKPDFAPDYYSSTLPPIIEGVEGNAKFCGEHLCRILSTNNVDVVVFIGLDCWAFNSVFKVLVSLHNSKRFSWVSIFPFDQLKFRQDWLPFLKPVDMPCVYSEYGKQMLEPYVPNIRYFRPPISEDDLFPMSKEDRLKERRNMFPSLGEDQILFGFIGNNQWRKDPLRVIRAFLNAKEKVPNIVLYMHTEYSSGVFNIPAYIEDCGGKQGDIFLKQEGIRYFNMNPIYNVMDCLINASLQEGLSFTLLEAMLCGCPVIAADNTAQTELLDDEAGYKVECTDLAFVPITTQRGLVHSESRACNLDSLEKAIIRMASDKELREKYSINGLRKAKEWLSSPSDINKLIEEAHSNKTKVFSVARKKRAILFAQHSSAGDVLMTTQCFKGIKERHGNKPLIYMTQKIYQDIIRGNPLIDGIMDWDEELLKEYEIVYNPHGERILKGRFNRLDATLYSLYPYFCKVKPDRMFINKVNPNIKLPDAFIVVHTTGGDLAYRMYEHMDIVVENMPVPCVQIGGPLDKACKNVIDLRKLSFRETAFVMSKALMAIVIDSFPSHLAGALGVPAIVLYGPAPSRVTRPRDDNGVIVNLEPNWLDVCKDLSLCWGASGTNSCVSPCINTISPFTIIKKAKGILEAIKGEGFFKKS